MSKKANDVQAEIEALRKRVEELERKNPLVVIQPAPYPVYVQPWWGWNPYPYYVGPSWIQRGTIIGGLNQGNLQSTTLADNVQACLVGASNQC